LQTKAKQNLKNYMPQFYSTDRGCETKKLLKRSSICFRIFKRLVNYLQFQGTFSNIIVLLKQHFSNRFELKWFVPWYRNNRFELNRFTQTVFNFESR